MKFDTKQLPKVLKRYFQETGIWGNTLNVIRPNFKKNWTFYFQAILLRKFACTFSFFMALVLCSPLGIKQNICVFHRPYF